MTSRFLITGMVTHSAFYLCVTWSVRFAFRSRRRFRQTRDLIKSRERRIEIVRPTAQRVAILPASNRARRVAAHGDARTSTSPTTDMRNFSTRTALFALLCIVNAAFAHGALHQARKGQRAPSPSRSLLAMNDACSTHAGCADGEYCDTTSKCWPCQSCNFLNDSIDGSCPARCGVCPSETTSLYVYHGACGGLSKKSDKWCGGYCLATTEDDCCEPDGGPIAGLVIGLIVGLALIITLFAYCCKCCCFRRPPVVMQPQSPQVVYVQNPPPV